jgi:hypothetical protein
MTPEEIQRLAEASANNLADGRQRGLLMWRKELVTLLTTAYCEGFKAGVDKSVETFAPAHVELYRQLTG